jgi:hypothetical protein
MMGHYDRGWGTEDGGYLKTVMIRIGLARGAASTSVCDGDDDIRRTCLRSWF